MSKSRTSASLLMEWLRSGDFQNCAVLRVYGTTESARIGTLKQYPPKQKGTSLSIGE